MLNSTQDQVEVEVRVELGKTGKQLNELEDMELEEVTHCVLREINHELGHMGSSISEFPDLPAPPPMTDTEEVARVLREEIFDKRSLIKT